VALNLLIRLKTTIFTLMIIISLSSNAEIYQWKDKNGNVYFSDKQNMSKSSKSVTLKQGNNLNFTKPKTADWLKSYDQQNALKQKQQAQQKLTKQKREAVCDYWESRQQIYKQAGPIAFMSAEGERHYLNEEERSQQVAKLKANLRKYCR
jgi:5-bromo-4-chloroindolyl phosphate hydrolysis protein